MSLLTKLFLLFQPVFLYFHVDSSPATEDIVSGVLKFLAHSLFSLLETQTSEMWNAERAALTPSRVFVLSDRHTDLLVVYRW